MAYQPQPNVRKIHWTWIVIAVIVVAIPLTLFITSQNTDNRQHASELSNPVVKLDLKGECKGKNEPKNSYRRAEYTCQNGAQGELPNNNNSCDKRTDWMDKAKKRCDAAIVPAIPSTTESDIGTDMGPDTTVTPAEAIEVGTTPPPMQNSYTLTCNILGGINTDSSQGVFIAAKLQDNATNKPVYNATITWRTEPALVNAQGFKPTTTTSTTGNGATYNFVGPGQGSLRDMDVFGKYEYTVPGTQTTAATECRVIFTF